MASLGSFTSPPFSLTPPLSHSPTRGHGDASFCLLGRGGFARISCHNKVYRAANLARGANRKSCSSRGGALEVQVVYPRHRRVFACERRAGARAITHCHAATWPGSN